MQQPSVFKELRAQIDNALEQTLDTRLTPSRLSDAMRYSALLGGKRVRPMLTLMSARCFGATPQVAMPAAVAIELIHAYSLVHDDLPAMDDDALRRGQPTCHIAFDEATAILTGDALQAMAFEILTSDDNDLSSDQRVALVRTLSEAAGARGMVLGQAIDLEAVGRHLDLSALENMHRHKTGKLIEASVTMGAICANADAVEHREIKAFARHLGLAFQVQDDILDVTGDTKIIGKTAGADEAANKPTYVSILGLEGALDLLNALHKECLQSLDQLSQRDTNNLRSLADYVVHRTQ